MVDVTYSLESAFVKAYSAVAVGVQCLLDAAGTLERITRPPVRHSGFDEPSPLSDTPNPTEPSLTPDELVGVRGLLQERYEEVRPKWITDLIEATTAGERPPDVDPFPLGPSGGPPLDWHGWATPAILTVLAEHFPYYDDDAGMYECVDDMGCVDASFGDTHAWRKHIAPKIADRIACDPARAIAALQSFKPHK